MAWNWKVTFNSTAYDLFSGQEDENIDRLFMHIDQSKALHSSVPALLDIEHGVLRAAYALLIPYTWKLRDHHPVLIDGEWGCGDVGVGDYDVYFPSDNDKSTICVGERKYWLLNPEGPARTCRDLGNWGQSCEYTEMKPLDGFDSLGERNEDTDMENWGGITREAVARRYVTSGEPL